MTIDRDNFDQVMQRMTPGLKMRVDNTLKNDGSELAVDLKFKSIDDFEPAAIIDQVEPLKNLLETRKQAARPNEQGGSVGEPGSPAGARPAESGRPVPIAGGSGHHRRR